MVEQKNRSQRLELIKQRKEYQKAMKQRKEYSEAMKQWEEYREAIKQRKKYLYESALTRGRGVPLRKRKVPKSVDVLSPVREVRD